MKKLFVLILVLLVFVIGCGNESTNSIIDPNRPIPNGPMLDGHPVYDYIRILPIGKDEVENSDANEALNLGVAKLGDLNGYAQFYNVVLKDQDQYLARKIFVNGNSIKYSEVEMYYTDGSPSPTRKQRVVEYSLGGETTDFILEYYKLHGIDIDLVPIKEVAKSDYEGYKLYNVTTKRYERISSGPLNSWPNWEADVGEIGQSELRLIKNTSTEFNASRESLENVPNAPNKYMLIVSAVNNDIVNPNFSKEIVVAEKF